MKLQIVLEQEEEYSGSYSIVFSGGKRKDAGLTVEEFNKLLRIVSRYKQTVLGPLWFSFGVGLQMSAMTAKYRDLSFLTGFLVQVRM